MRALRAGLLLPLLVLLAAAGSTVEPSPLAAVASAGAARALPGPDADVPAAADAAPAEDLVLDRALRPLRVDRTAADGAFDPALAPFPVTVGDFAVAHRVMAVSALPGEEVEIVAQAVTAGGDTPVLRYADGRAEGTRGRWRWTAPDDPGVYALSVEAPAGAVHLNVLVLHPRSLVRGGVLNGFQIGEYRETPLRGDPTYLPPIGFVEVESGLREVLVSPHFTLEQFLCKQQGDPPYLAYSPTLVKKLELVLAAVNAAGIRTPSLYVMSGFRTPWYNRSIGNTTSYSRHLWGDAADVFVDVDGNGYMDDLNGDGRSDVRDGRILSAIVDEVERKEAEAVPGGLSVYRRNAVRGPFVHVDARGTPARW